MKKITKSIFIVLILIALAVSVGVYYFFNEFNLLGDCKEEKVAAFEISMNTNLATYIVNCGATTDYNTKVVFRQDDKTEIILSLKGHHAKDIWLDPKGDQIVIHYKLYDSQEVYRSIGAYGGFKFVFVQDSK